MLRLRNQLPTLLALLLLVPAANAGTDTALEAVETFFTAMAENNWSLAEPVMIDDAVLYGYRLEDGEVQLSRTTAGDYLKSAATRDARMLERIWDVEILEHDRLATIWTPYDFYLDGKFHHCGRNSFSLIRNADGWRIASIVYSMLTENCEPSPLGPPEIN